MSFLASVAVLSAVYLVVGRLERTRALRFRAAVRAPPAPRHRPRLVRRRHRRPPPSRCSCFRPVLARLSIAPLRDALAGVPVPGQAGARRRRLRPRVVPRAPGPAPLRPALEHPQGPPLDPRARRLRHHPHPHGREPAPLRPRARRCCSSSACPSASSPPPSPSPPSTACATTATSASTCAGSSRSSSPRASTAATTCPSTTMNNYGGILTIWDRLAGTLVRADTAPDERYGVPGEIDTYPQRFADAFRQPFKPATPAATNEPAGAA